MGDTGDDWERADRPPLDARAGINTGKMLVGNLGSRRIMDYTVMGDHVNLASRLEGTNRLYGTAILVSEFTWREVAEQFVGRELDRIRVKVKGKEDAVAIHEVLATNEDGVPPDTLALLEGFRDADLYRRRRFDDALSAFTSLAERFPADGPTQLYVERCREYGAEPPGDGWDGVYVMKSK